MYLAPAHVSVSGGGWGGVMYGLEGQPIVAECDFRVGYTRRFCAFEFILCVLGTLMGGIFLLGLLNLSAGFLLQQQLKRGVCPKYERR